jgi:hypothetical protein
MTQQEALTIYLTKVRDEIFVRQRANGQQASGYSEQNTTVVVKSPTYGYIDSPLYLATNFKGIGRKPGTMPPIKSIKEWIELRGLRLNPWAVAMNIKKRGTVIYRDRRKGIDFNQIQQKYMDEFLNNLAKSLTK